MLIVADISLYYGIKSYGENSLRLPLGLPVGVVNSSQDHPGLVMSGTLKTQTKRKLIHTLYYP